MRNLTFVRFRDDVSMGNYDRNQWTSASGATDSVAQTLKFAEMDNGDIQMTWTGVVPHQVNVIPRGNVAQIRYEATATAVKK